jgi:hypothetical protein
MMGRDAQFGAESGGLRPPAGDATGALVRPLGAFERLYHRYAEKIEFGTFEARSATAQLVEFG